MLVVASKGDEDERGLVFLYGQLRLTVADTGAGMKAETGRGIGLINLRTRLAEMYGDRGKLVVEDNAPSGVRATIEIPDPGDAR